ncbi:MAG: NADH-quinone oxidoreductase subunit NuoK [Planctomycetota bacterium]|jgi:NADH-quinone oxidoreductase subunit K
MDWLFTKAPLENMLILSAAIFCCGLYTIITRKNAIAILMGVELILNAANINFIAFAQYGGHGVDGAVFALFVIVLAAAEAAVALAIVIGIYQNFGRVDVDETTLMKE